MKSNSLAHQTDPLLQEAMQHFGALRSEAVAMQNFDPDVMSLATASRYGEPSVRTVLLANASEHGFAFMINSKSGKGAQLQQNPHAALAIYWGPMDMQVVVEGQAVQLSAEEADRLWHKRSRSMQLGAWASQQSQETLGRKELRSETDRLQRSFEDQRVPRPDYWIAYNLLPKRIEFWHSVWQHLRERVCYRRVNNGWEKIMLDP